MLLINSKFDCKNITYTEIVCGRLIAIEFEQTMNTYIVINIYGPNNDDTSIFEQLDKFILEHEEKKIIIGGDINTVLDTEIDKKNGRKDGHKKCRQKLKDIIEKYSVFDIWRTKNPHKRQFTWHSHDKPAIFCRLDFFLISQNLLNNVCLCKIENGYKSDHSRVTLSMNTHIHTKGKGYFKINNSLLLKHEYQNVIRKIIDETAMINAGANPNTMWEIMKGNIRNETIKFASKTKQDDEKREKEINLKLINLEQTFSSCSLNNDIDKIKSEIEKNKEELNEIYDKKINGIILRSKALNVEYNEKNSKLFANLEKRNSEKRL